MKTWPRGDPSEVVKQILAQPAYRSKTAGAETGHLRFWYEFWAWVGRITKPFWDWLDHLFKSAHGVATPLTYVVVGLLALSVAFLIVRIVLAFAKPALDARQEARTGGTVSERPSAEEWQRRAAQAGASGDYARAIAALFAAALAALDERMLVPFDASRTPGEYRRLVRRVVAAAETPFDALSERFVYAAFAARESDRADYEAALGAYQRFRPALSPR